MTRAAASVLAVLLAPSLARAGNQDSFFQGNEAATVGGAVVAITHDGAAVWYNPAGLGANDRDELDLSGSAFVLRVRRIEDGLVTGLVGETAREDLESVEILSVPSALVMARRISDRVSVGVGVFVSQQDSFTLRGSNDARLRAADVDLLETARVGGSAALYHLGPAVGWQPHPRVRVGASLFAVYEQANGFARVSVDLDNRATVPGSRLVVIGDTNIGRRRGALEAAIGAQVEPIDGLHLGVTVRSPRLLLAERLDADVLSSVAAVGGPGPPVVESEFDDDPFEEAGVGLVAPARVLAGVAYEHERGFVSVEGDFSHGIEDEATRVRVEPTWNVRVGARVRVADDVTLGAGFFTDRSNQPPVRQLPDLDVDYYGGTVGLTWDTRVVLGPEEDADDLVFSSTFGLRYAIGVGDGISARFDVVADDAEPFRSRSDPVDVTFHELSLHVGSGVQF